MERKYQLPNEHDAALAAEPNAQTTRVEDLHNMLVSRVMEIQNPEVLQSLILYVDKTVRNSSKANNAFSVPVDTLEMASEYTLKEVHEGRGIVHEQAMSQLMFRRGWK